MKKVNIGVAGLGFGKEFASIYCDHPDVDKVAICTRNPNTLKAVGDELGIPEELRFTNFDDMVKVFFIAVYGLVATVFLVIAIVMVFLLLIKMLFGTDTE